MKIVTVLHLAAQHTTNGNPRRLFVGLDQHGHIGCVTDEGLEGTPEWVKQLQARGVYAFPLHVSASVYRDTKRQCPPVPHHFHLAPFQMPAAA